MGDFVKAHRPFIDSSFSIAKMRRGLRYPFCFLFRKESSCQFFDINPGKIWFIMRSYLLIAYVEGLLICLSTTLRAYPAKNLSLESSVSLTCS